MIHHKRHSAETTDPGSELETITGLLVFAFVSQDYCPSSSNIYVLKAVPAHILSGVSLLLLFQMGGSIQSLLCSTGCKWMSTIFLLKMVFS